MKIYIVCPHNRCRSQMAEAFTWQISRGTVLVEAPDFIHYRYIPLIVEVMKEAGIDISEYTVCIGISSIMYPT